MSLQNKLQVGYKREENKRMLEGEIKEELYQVDVQREYRETPNNYSRWEVFWYDFFEMDLEMDKRQ